MKNRLKVLRAERDLTQADLANEVSVSETPPHIKVSLLATIANGSTFKINIVTL